MKDAKAYVFGKWHQEFPLDQKNIKTLIKKAEERMEDSFDISIDSRIKTICKLHEVWKTDGKYQNEFLNLVPERTVTLSHKMIKLGVDAFTKYLDADVAYKRLSSQLGDSGMMETVYKKNGRSTRAVPLGILLHVVSGNIFFGPAQSLLAGLLTKNVNIVKCTESSRDFTFSFVRSIEEIDKRLAGTIAVLDWPGGTFDVESALSTIVDGIIVAAGGDTIRSYRQNASAATEIIEFGPRISVSVIAESGIDGFSFDDLALDVSLWDQLACTASQYVYVSGKGNALSVAGKLSEALSRLEIILPEGNISVDERIEIKSFRETAGYKSLTSPTKVFSSKNGGSWTVVYNEDTALSPSPLRRCVTIKPYSGSDDLTRMIRPLRGFLQTIGLACSVDERTDYERLLFCCGARRICNIGKMNMPSPYGLHDGSLDISRLVRRVEIEE